MVETESKVIRSTRKNVVDIYNKRKLSRAHSQTKERMGEEAKRAEHSTAANEREMRKGGQNMGGERSQVTPRLRGWPTRNEH